MPSWSTPPVLAERGDIHKSCKAIETLLNILSEYCEAAGVVVSLQKKLAKALKDAASSKATAEIASSTLSTSANVFESLSEVDSKFSKILDKEYDMISDEVKKSFKKLTREEKAHDEKMSAANEKIKQAGQTYEKKAKKRAAEANEEHARYINLINTLGPEMSQHQYNHAVTASQRHIAMIYSVASCLGRLADLEWQKSCECVRRFSPNIGPLGNLRSLCEGGWTGSIPPDLPDSSPTGNEPTPLAEANKMLGAIEEVSEHRTPLTNVNRNLPTFPSINDFDSQVSHKSTEISISPIPFPSVAIAPGDTLQPPTAPFVDPNTGSVRSLSAFPTPPSHLPLPPLRQQQTLSLTTRSSTSILEFPSSPLADSPISSHDDLSAQEPAHAQQSDSVRSSAPSPQGQSYEELTAEIHQANNPTGENIYRRPQTSLPTESLLNNSLRSPHLHGVEIKPLNIRSHREEDSPTNKEFGVRDNNLPSPVKFRTMDNFKYPGSIERTDTGTTGSIVGAMRNRYDNNSGSMSPSRDLPPSPLHNNIAARYQNNNLQHSPNSKTNSPPVLRQQSLPLLGTSARPTLDSYPTGSINPDEERRRRPKEVELAGISRTQKEWELREREAELESRVRELERDRAQLQVLRAGGDDVNDRQVVTGKLGLYPERRLSSRHRLQRPLEHDAAKEERSLTRVPSTSRALPPRPRTQESNTHHLVPPPSANSLHSSPASPSSPLLHSESQGSQASNRSRDDVSHSYTSTSTSSIHASFCGCEKCSVGKYRGQPKDQQSSSNESRREKSKLGTGWIKRLSIPVGNMAMKRPQSNDGIGVSNKGAGLLSLDSKKSLSTIGSGVDEVGKLARPGEVALGRRSYDLSAMNNRSLTNVSVRHS